MATHKDDKKSDSTSVGDCGIVCSIKTVLYPGWEVQLFIAVATDGDTIRNWKNVCLDGSKRV
mgnify:CR=1 FL=1